MLEILSPAVSPEGVIAAVQNGADSIYLNFDETQERQETRGFTRDELGRALEYCRVRGVKTYLSIETPLYDKDLPAIAQRAKEACRLGIDAIIISDLGAMLAIRQAVPQVPIHAGEQLCIHNLEGVKMAAAMGLKRVTLARELSRKKIDYICKHSKIEIEVVVHGEQCISYSGLCYMDKIKGKGKIGNKQCSEPCRLNYNTIGNITTHPLSLKDSCLVQYLDDMEILGVTCGKIDGLTKRPEYSAIVTEFYSKAAHKGRITSNDDLRVLEETFSPKGLTDGYYADRQNMEMLGINTPDNDNKNEDAVIFTTARKNYLNGEFQRVPIRFVGSVTNGKKVKLAAADENKNTAVVYGAVPEPAFHKELTIASLQTQLHKTSGTPFYCVGVKGTVGPGLSLPQSELVDMSRKLLAEILEQRKYVTERIEGEFTPVEHIDGHEEPPQLTVSIMRLEQLSMSMVELNPGIIYIPVVEIYDELPALQALIENGTTKVGVTLPRVIHDNERKDVSEFMSKAVNLGITDALVGNIGHILFARKHGMRVRGDYGLNVRNSETLKALDNLGLESATLSYELNLNEIRSISKLIDTELIIYGRLPLMITETCISKNSMGICNCDNYPGLEDSQGAVYPFVPEFGCRNILLNTKKLYMADRRSSLSSLGIWAGRLMFTTENALECTAVLKRYMGLSNYAPSGYTRGQFFKE